ncbi:MAG: ClpXP protease specificity-enhancing factor SspB [Alphaproteobacteria bacterium]|nr:ClpXP protease specificity-enhancing factor SspB [Alphaproteobacteria bacterium]
MVEDLMRYDLLAQNALRSVVRDVLKQLKNEKIPSEHHFYIAFRTDAPGVHISKRLKNLYPSEITIVLQHQFWGFDVDEEKFQVSLSFNGIAETLVVPFSSIKGFFDPTVQFGLQFELLNQDAEQESTPLNTKVASHNETQEQNTKNDEQAIIKSPEKADASGPVDVKGEEIVENEGADIVSLDTFRKKPEKKT